MFLTTDGADYLDKRQRGEGCAEESCSIAGTPAKGFGLFHPTAMLFLHDDQLGGSLPRQISEFVRGFSQFLCVEITNDSAASVQSFAISQVEPLQVCGSRIGIVFKLGKHFGRKLIKRFDAVGRCFIVASLRRTGCTAAQTENGRDDERLCHGSILLSPPVNRKNVLHGSAARAHRSDWAHHSSSNGEPDTE